MKFTARTLLTLGMLISVTSGCSEPTQPYTVTNPGTPAAPGAPDTPGTGGYHVYLATASGTDLRQLGRGYSPVWSPDGSQIAFVRCSEGNCSGIQITDEGGTEQRQLTSYDYSWGPRWSPDGRRIAFAACIPNDENGPFPMCDGSIRVINTDGSGERTLAPAIGDPVWSPDGNKIALVGLDLHVINPDGTGLTLLAQLVTRRDGSVMVTGGDWSPDGRRIALGAAGSVYVINADGSNLTQLTNDTDSLVVRSVVWSPGGDRIAFSLSLDPLARETKDPESLKIHVINADGTNRISVATHATEPRWLPDGRTLSFGRWFVDEIWTASADGGSPSRVLSNGFGAVWSPDGTQIAYAKQH